jgi:hypothetical protein
MLGGSNMTTLTSTLTCPKCGEASEEVMPTDACEYFHDCRRCSAVLLTRCGGG